MKSVDQDLYFLAAEQDHIAPWRSSYKGAMIPAGNVRFVLSNSGHIAGIVNPPNPKSKHWVADLEELPENPDEWLAAALLVAQDADGVGLKISKAAGLTPGRRHRDLCRAAGLTVSVQETTGSSIAFAAIIHLGATVPPHLLRCILNTQDMVSLTTAHLDAVFTNRGVLPGESPGLGITVDEDALGQPTMTWSG